MSPKKRDPPEHAATSVLLRSQMEIARVLRELAKERSVVCTDVEGGERLYISRVIHVDPDQVFFTLAYSDEKSANAALLEQPAVVFRAQHRGARVEFSANAPQDIVIDGKAQVRCDFPDALIEYQQREHPRYPVMDDVSLRCVADSAGFAPFEARIADISLGGIGAMTYDNDIKLQPGTVLKGCLVVIPGREAVKVDIEVRYSKTAVLPGGGLINRAGVRFLRTDNKIRALVSNFVVELKD